MLDAGLRSEVASLDVSKEAISCFSKNNDPKVSFRSEINKICR